MATLVVVVQIKILSTLVGMITLHETGNEHEFYECGCSVLFSLAIINSCWNFSIFKSVGLAASTMRLTMRPHCVSRFSTKSIEL